MNEKVPCTECGKVISARFAGLMNGLCFACNDKHVPKAACAECGQPVSAKLPSKRNGLCLRCSAKRNPFLVLYSSLIDQVCNSTGGFSSLSDSQKLYYALTLFQNEVNNGGFHQFFFNNSGSYYPLIENGLVAFDETGALALLHRAKQILYPDAPVPTDTHIRRQQLATLDPEDERMRQLDELDQQFYRHPDTLSPKLQALALDKGLISQ